MNIKVIVIHVGHINVIVIHLFQKISSQRKMSLIIIRSYSLLKRSTIIEWEIHSSLTDILDIVMQCQTLHV
jgi:hypothetical protein